MSTPNTQSKGFIDGRVKTTTNHEQADGSITKGIDRMLADYYAMDIDVFTYRYIDKPRSKNRNRKVHND